MKPHKHAELIKAWADGAEIQYKTDFDEWDDIDNPRWDEKFEYRIRPEPKSNIVLMTCVYPWHGQIALSTARPNLRLTFNPAGTRLLTAEIL